jgi:hypothetical protein
MAIGMKSDKENCLKEVYTSFYDLFLLLYFKMTVCFLKETKKSINLSKIDVLLN